MTPASPRAPKGRAPRIRLVAALRALADVPHGPRLLRFDRPTQRYHLAAPAGTDAEHVYTADQAAAYLTGAHEAAQAILEAFPDLSPDPAAAAVFASRLEAAAAAYARAARAADPSGDPSP